MDNAFFCCSHHFPLSIYHMAMICRRYHSPKRRHRQPCQIDAKFGNHLHLYLDLPFAATWISYCAPVTTNSTSETYILNTIIPFYATLHIHRMQSPFTMAPTTTQSTNSISDFMPLFLLEHFCFLQGEEWCTHHHWCRKGTEYYSDLLCLLESPNHRFLSGSCF